jgi:hypothetical protein
VERPLAQEGVQARAALDSRARANVLSVYAGEMLVDTIDIPRSFLTEREVALLLRCSARHVADLRRSGLLAHVSLGKRRVIYSAEGVEQFLRRQTREAHEAVA